VYTLRIPVNPSSYSEEPSEPIPSPGEMVHRVVAWRSEISPGRSRDASGQPTLAAIFEWQPTSGYWSARTLDKVSLYVSKVEKSWRKNRIYLLPQL